MTGQDSVSGAAHSSGIQTPVITAADGSRAVGGTGNTVEQFTPRTELGRKLWALRQKHIAEHGKLLSLDEINEMVRNRR